MATRILNFGHDRTLLSTRGQVLSQDGFEVVSVTDSGQAIGALIAQRVDLLVLCHTLLEPERQRILSIARTSGQETKALVLLTPSSGLIPADSPTSVCSIDGPRSLLATIHELIGQHETSLQSLAP
jgi:CheY-like chemotaxis protein